MTYKNLWPLIEAAKELRDYASYAEMVGGVSVNRDEIRELCDTILELLPRDEFGNMAETPTDSILKSYPLEACVWFRESTKEWVLEISGTINDTNLLCRHTQPGDIAPEDVPGLCKLYERLNDD